MKINPIQFNFVQSKPQTTVSCPLRMNNGLQADTVSFSSLFGKEKAKTPEKALYDCVPKHKGIIYKKVRDENGNVVETEPVEVDIVKEFSDIFSFEIDGEEIGYVDLSYIPADKCKKEKLNIYKNYKDEGIEGDRIIVDYVENHYQDEYGGIGHLADLVEVAVCKELGIKPNVVSVSRIDAAPLHYKRGKRFVPYEKYVNNRTLKKLNVKNPNEVLKQTIAETLEGENFGIPDLHSELIMYMPKKMIKELEEELEEHPIF